MILYERCRGLVCPQFLFVQHSLGPGHVKILVVQKKTAVLHRAHGSNNAAPGSPIICILKEFYHQDNLCQVLLHDQAQLF